VLGAMRRQTAEFHPSMRVAPGDPEYLRQAELEGQFWSHTETTVALFESHVTRDGVRFLNRVLTGNPDTTRLDDTIARDPYRQGAMLGCTEKPRAATEKSACLLQ
jgi:hypothetical protein